MDSIIVEPSVLKGKVRISGSKNASLPIICASLLIDEVSLIDVPRIKDIEILLDILKKLNCSIRWKHNRLYINSKNIIYKPLTIENISLIRGSYYLIPIMLYLFNRCEIAYPGGCSFDSRPIDLHIELFRSLGYLVDVKENSIIFTQKEKIKKISYFIPRLSVGASINAILGALSFDYIVLDGLNIEPEGRSVISFLKNIGFDIMAIGGRCIFKSSRPKVLKYSYRIIPDRMEMMTYIVMGLLCGKVKLFNIDYNQIRYPVDLLIKHGYKIDINKDNIISYKSRGEAFDIETSEYPLLPTDMQPLLGVLSLFSRGYGKIVDNIYPSRIQLYKELNKIANINIIGNSVYYIGSDYLATSTVKANDLRNAAGLFLYSLKSGGIILNYKIIERGYQDFYKKIKYLGAKITINSKK